MLRALIESPLELVYGAWVCALITLMVGLFVGLADSVATCWWFLVGRDGIQVTAPGLDGRK